MSDCVYLQQHIKRACAYLEILVLVEAATGEPGNLGYRSDVNVGVGEEEEVDRAAGRHALLTKLRVER